VTVPRNRISRSIIALLESLVGHVKFRFRNGVCQTRLTSMDRNSRLNTMNSERLACAESWIRNTTPQLQRGNLTTLVCVSSPLWFIYYSWGSFDTEADKEETSSCRSLSIKVHCDTSTDFLIKQFSVTTIYANTKVTSKRVGQNNPQRIPWCWPGDGELILLIVTSIVDTSILSIMNPAIAGLPNPRWKIGELWDSWEQRNGDGSLSACHIPPICDHHTAAGWANLAMNVCNLKQCCVSCSGQQANIISGTQTPMCSGHSYHFLDDIVPPPAIKMINKIGEFLSQWNCR